MDRRCCRWNTSTDWLGRYINSLSSKAKTGGSLDPGAWAMGALLYFWQMPHFLALSWNLKNDYQLGGIALI